MKGMAKLIRRCVGILSVSTFLILALNVCLFVAISMRQTANVGPWTLAGDIPCGRICAPWRYAGGKPGTDCGGIPG